MTGHKRGRPVNPNSARQLQQTVKKILQIGIQTLRPIDPQAWDRDVDAQAKVVKKHANMWRSLRRDGVTNELLDMDDCMNPDVMAPSELLSPAQAAVKYKHAIKEHDRKTKRTQSARAKGSATMANRPRELATFIRDNFPDVIQKMHEKHQSAVWAEKAIRQRMERESRQWQGCVDPSKGPSSRTLRESLSKLAKAASR